MSASSSPPPDAGDGVMLLPSPSAAPAATAAPRAPRPERDAQQRGDSGRNTRASFPARTAAALLAGARGGLGRAGAQLPDTDPDAFREAFDGSPIGMALVGLDGRLLRINQRLCEITGYQRERLLDLTFQQITHPDDLHEDGEQMRRLLDGTIHRYQMEKRFLRGAGEVMWGLLSVALVRDSRERPRYVVAHIQDVTERRRFESDLSHLAHHDPLTGLYNRRRFEVELNRQVLASERLGVSAALVMLDLDNFKYINDTLGHAAGDELLRRVAEALQRRLRRTDLLARLGGDEFAAILPGVEPEAAREIAESLLEIIRRDCVVDGSSGEATRVTASIGVAPIEPHVVRSPEQLLIDADVAMYAAKSAGRTQVVMRAPERDCDDVGSASPTGAAA